MYSRVDAGLEQIADDGAIAAIAACVLEAFD